MTVKRWYVQAKGEDGLFRTIEHGEHANLSTAFAQYSANDAEDGPGLVVQLVRGDHVVIRSDQWHHPRTHEVLYPLGTSVSEKSDTAHEALF